MTILTRKDDEEPSFSDAEDFVDNIDDEGSSNF